jgi:hypothetical protein
MDIVNKDNFEKPKSLGECKCSVNCGKSYVSLQLVYLQIWAMESIVVGSIPQKLKYGKCRRVNFCIMLLNFDEMFMFS